MSCRCDCKHCREDNHCFRHDCYKTQRRATNLVCRGRVIAHIEWCGDFIFLGKAKGYRLVPPDPE